MDFNERFTEGASRALALSQECARDMGHNYVGSEHILIGLIREDGAAAQALARAGVFEKEVLERADELVGRGDFHFTDSFGYTPRTKKILELSLYEAKSLKNSYIGTEHILLAILRERDCVAVRIMEDLGADLDKLKRSLTSKSASLARSSGKAAANETPVLNQYARDLSALARDGMLDPVIGREKEIRRIVQILSRRTKNNPVLIGDPGVGKSAIIEGLAQLIISGNMPEPIKGKRLVTLDLAGMLAGTKYRGEFEERIKNALNELSENGQTILFIDELHTIVGAGASEGSIDASSILKPALARGEIQVIGATTLDEYRRYIEKDAALERRFQPVTVGEPTREEAMEILLGLRDRYEAHHRARITDEAIYAAVEMSSRYISDRFLPDKAIDLMDEAASRARLRTYTSPPDIKEMESRLEALLKEKEEAIVNQNFERAAAIRDEENSLRTQMGELRLEWDHRSEDTECSVNAEDIAEVVESWTGIPVSQLTENESEKLLRLEESLKERVIGQDEAVSAVSRAIRRARAGLKDPNRPIGSFLFLGPTGVGKTELSKSLANILFSRDDALIRLDMPEYMEAHSVSKLIGSPPGYVGYDDGGQLTEKVRRRPYCTVLLDEIEKAHPDVFNLLLQVLEDGRLTDSHGRTVDFRNTVIIMTSNVGADEFARPAAVGFGAAERSPGHDEMLSKLKKTFSPEFLNRVDDIIVFNSLAPDKTESIVRLMLKDVITRLDERGIALTVTDGAVAQLASSGFDPVYGARPLRRAIQHQLEDSLSEELIAGRVSLGDSVTVTAKDGKLIFTRNVRKKETV